jgi:hypothetical protein
VPPPVCGPAFGSCSGGASGGDAWASASDTVNTVTSAGAAARLNAARGRMESALRREITSDVLISNLLISRWMKHNQAYRDDVADQVRSTSLMRASAILDQMRMLAGTWQIAFLGKVESRATRPGRQSWRAPAVARFQAPVLTQRCPVSAVFMRAAW